MKELTFNTIQEFNDCYGLETQHPLVSVVRYDKEHTLEEHTAHYELYALFLKENKGCTLSYGRTEYDFDEMTVTSFAPGQSIHVEPSRMSSIRSGQHCSSTPICSTAHSWDAISAATNSSITLQTRLFTSLRRKWRYSVECCP